MQSFFNPLTKSDKHPGYINSNNVYQSDGIIHRATYPSPWVTAQVKHNEVGVAVVGVLEASDHVAVVLRDGQVADSVGEPNGGVVAELTDQFISEQVPENDRRSIAKLLRACEHNALAVVHKTARCA